MTIRYLFIVFLILCTSGMRSLCMASPIVVDYSLNPKTTFNPSAVSKEKNPDKLISQQSSKSQNTQRHDDAPSKAIGINIKEFQPSQAFQPNQGFQSHQEFQNIEEFQPNNNLLPSKAPQEDKESIIQLGFSFNGFHEIHTPEENSTSQQQPNQENKNHSSLNLEHILRDTVKDSEVLMELAEGTIETYRSFNTSSSTNGFQSTPSAVDFGNDNFESSRNFLNTTPLIAVQQRTTTAQRSWGEQTFFDKLIQFCFSWKGLVTLCGFLIFNSILFKLV